MIKLEINAAVSGIALIASGHANEMKFKGVLVNLDTPSTKPPNGSQGKRILIPSSTGRAALHTLINMGVNYTNELDGHNPRKKVGVIKKAWIEGKDIHVSGVIWKKDFPEAEKDLKQKNLGMSFEATDITLEDVDAKIWKITSMCFTGASILYKKDAAYHATEALAAAKLRNAASQITKIQGGISMAHSSKSKVTAKKSSKKVSANATGGDNIGEVLVGLTDALRQQTKAFNTMTASNHTLRSEMHELSARAIEEELASEEIEAAGDSEEEDSEDVHAAWDDKKGKKKKDDASDEESSSEEDEESMSADADDKGDLEDMESDEPDEDDKPGSLNKNAKQKGDQTQVEDKVGKEVNEPILGSSLRKLMRSVNQLKAARANDQKKIAKLERKYAEAKTQISAAAGRTERKSVSPLGRSMLVKGGVEPDAIQASGKKMTVDEVDSLFASSGANLDPTQRMALKGEYVRAGIMEEGIVTRTPVN